MEQKCSLFIFFLPIQLKFMYKNQLNLQIKFHHEYLLIIPDKKLLIKISLYEQKQIYMKKSILNLKSRKLLGSNRPSQTNRSKTKQAHSFGKSSRFFDEKPACKIHFYKAGQGMNHKTGTNMGYGNKSDFTKDLTCSPGSGRYRIMPQMDERIAKKKGYSIAVGRDQLSYGQYINKQLCKNPSSQKYQINLSTRRKAPVYSMRVKTKLTNKTMSIQSQNENPGPTHYRNPQQLTDSRFSSKYPTIKYSASRSKRFQTSENKSPGPGAYNQISKLSNVGKYIISNDHGGTYAKFGSSKRITKFDQEVKRCKIVPGAGSYQIPSQFCQYD